MATIPKKVEERIVSGIKRFQPILNASRSRDVGEADTVLIVTDMLSQIFGYDKYSEITAEYSIRGTYCDLAIKLDGKLQTLLEVKAIGLELKDAHAKQAVDYAANQGIDWVVLTNGMVWKIYKLTFSKPIDSELVVNIDLCSINPKNKQDIEMLYLLCKEGWLKSILGDYHTQKQVLSRYSIGAIILSKPVLEAIRRELKRISSDVKIDIDQISQVLSTEVLKREVLDGDKADEARKKISRVANKAVREKANREKPAIQMPAAAVESKCEPQNPESQNFI